MRSKCYEMVRLIYQTNHELISNFDNISSENNLQVALVKPRNCTHVALVYGSKLTKRQLCFISMNQHYNVQLLVQKLPQGVSSSVQKVTSIDSFLVKNLPPEDSNFMNIQIEHSLCFMLEFPFYITIYINIILFEKQQNTLTLCY